MDDKLVTVLPALLVVVAGSPVMVWPAESVVTTAPVGGPEMVERVEVIPELPVKARIVVPAELVVCTAFFVLEVTVLPAELVPTIGAPLMPVLATPRRALMADSSETMLGWYWAGMALRKGGGVGAARAERTTLSGAPVTPLAAAALMIAAPTGVATLEGI